MRIHPNRLTQALARTASLLPGPQQPQTCIPSPYQPGSVCENHLVLPIVRFPHTEQATLVRATSALLHLLLRCKMPGDAPPPDPQQPIKEAGPEPALLVRMATVFKPRGLFHIHAHAGQSRDDPTTELPLGSIHLPLSLIFRDHGGQGPR